jgi:predicted DNA-binding transcriptional regulator YafY
MGDPIALAQSHVISGRQIVSRQRALIERLRAHGRDLADAEELMDRFEASLRIFEEDLARLERECG